MASFGDDAEQYHCSRPSYPAELVNDLLRLGVRRVLDVGCGTGIAGLLFLRRGCEVVGVEHDPRMAEVARRQGLHVDVSRFEDWEPPDAPVDLVISAQAWHWIDPSAGVAKAARALRPGGVLAPMWNRYEHEPSISAEFIEVHERLAPELIPDSIPLGLMPPVDVLCDLGAIAESPLFDTPTVRHYPWERHYTTKQWVAELATHSRHHALPAATREIVLSEVGEVIDRHGGEMTVRMRTHLVTAVRRTG